MVSVGRAYVVIAICGALRKRRKIGRAKVEEDFDDEEKEWHRRGNEI